MDGRAVRLRRAAQACVAAGAALLLALSGFGVEAGASGRRPAAAHHDPAQARRPLAYPLAGTLTARRIGPDAGCDHGTWLNGRGPLGDPSLAGARSVRRYHCLQDEGAAAPDDEPQALFLTFRGAAQARAYVRAQTSQAWQAAGYLQDGPYVLEIDEGRPRLDRPALLRDAQAACGGCGALTLTWQAAGEGRGSLDG
ncbi:hypothetical protein [Actinomadura macrotermitis]|uniref:Uncharacterized protein n=1 Tax=Actinomadura macrotermitis TaxID=2585200 RepID=A0A7K0BLE3_9ACTN|nr:hypothetical protein [Actinomadura macrotermitis]MQY01999.1 hypothetical protein [Actinomadura macrotermitis]